MTVKADLAKLECRINGCGRPFGHAGKHGPPKPRPARRARRARPETHSCAEPGCPRQLVSEERCTEHGGLSAAQNRAVTAVYFGNPWASESPDCPRGHHARRVYRWSYDAGDPWPWFCPECKRRFAVVPLVDPGSRRGRQPAGGTPGSVDHSPEIPTLSEGS